MIWSGQPQQESDDDGDTNPSQGLDHRRAPNRTVANSSLIRSRRQTRASYVGGQSERIRGFEIPVATAAATKIPVFVAVSNPGTAGVPYTF